MSNENREIKGTFLWSNQERLPGRDGIRGKPEVKWKIEFSGGKSANPDGNENNTVLASVIDSALVAIHIQRDTVFLNILIIRNFSVFTLQI